LVGLEPFGVERSAFGDKNVITFEFEKLRVYQKALDFIDKVYEVTREFPSEEKFGLVDQFRRAAVSIALNTAEGSGGTKAEFKRFLIISRRSIRECVAVTEISFRRRYIDAETKETLRADCVDMSKMLTGLLKSLSPNDER
jgi:four helix bundle protein